ncbi:MFS transporter [Cytophagaceae bacterium ABcell3]|nr:MFS transporter [Cytophagaceae bacterium ABcell3]
MKNKKAFFLLFLADGVSGFAQGITMLAIPWYFADHHMGGTFSIYYAIITLASLFWGLYAGTIVDGFNRKDVFLGTNFISGLIIISIASLGFKEGVLPSALIMMVFTSTFFGYYIHYPNLYAFAQEITEPKDYTKVTSYIEIVGQTSTIAASALGAILLKGLHTEINFELFNTAVHIPINIDRWEIHEIFLMDGFTYMLSFILIIFIKYVPIKTVVDYDEGPLLERLRTGYNYLKKNPIVTLFGVCSYTIFIVGLIEMFSLIPLYVKNHLSMEGDVLGASKFMFGCGSLISGFIIGKLLQKSSIPKSIIILTALTTIFLFVISFTKDVWVFYIYSIVFGFANSGSRIFRVSYIFTLVPNEINGRVHSMFNVYTTIIRTVFIAAFALPFFTNGSNVTWAYFTLGVYALISTIILLAIYKKVEGLTQAKSSQEPETAEEPVH